MGLERAQDDNSRSHSGKNFSLTFVMSSVFATRWKSLVRWHKRDGTSIPEGAQLWSQYTRAAIQNTEGQPRILTFYEDYFRYLLDEINRVVGFCRLSRVDDPLTAQVIISGELRHQTIGTVELLNEGSVPLECKVLYLGLRLLALAKSVARRRSMTALNHAYRMASATFCP